MLKFLKAISASSVILIGLSFSANAQDAAAGKKVFKKCRACHAVGEGAKNKVGPQLNELFGRVAGSLDSYKYSKKMRAAGAGGLAWDDATLAQFVTKPKAFIKGTRMSFSGLKKEKDRINLIAYLKQFSASVEEKKEEPVKQEDSQLKKPAQTKVPVAKKVAEVATKILAKDTVMPTHGVLHIGRAALKEEISAWDIDIRPDGKGLPDGKGTVAQGEAIYSENCAVCHGDFGEGVDRWPVLAGGQGTLQEERPEKTIGSYWPYLSTVYDYVRRAMPFGNARSLSDDDVYALTAYLMFLNDLVTEEDFELSKDNFLEIRLPNEENFFDDDRSQEKHYATKTEPCMRECKPGKATVILRARVLDVTPDTDKSEDGASAEQ